jgi:predicted DNA-binding ribbon-helix-helix protein
MKTTVFKRSVAIGGRKTSVSLEAAFWDGVRQIATREGVATSALLSQIEQAHGTGNLSSAIRLFVLHDLQQRIDPSLRVALSRDSRGGQRRRQ